MTLDWTTTRIRSQALACFALLMATGSGCITFTKHAVPASRLPHQYQAPSKCNLHPINFQLLSSNQSEEHLLDAEDVVAITVQGILPPKTETLPPLVSSQASMIRDYYPPLGAINSPSYGIPFHVQMDGTVHLPELAPIVVRGLSLQTAAQEIANAYIKKDVLKQESAQVSITLLKSRVNRVVVLREDASLEAAGKISPRNETVLHKRGTGTLIDLPARESDVLHALAASGGLPGVDSYNEIWVLRKSVLSAEELSQIDSVLIEQSDPGAAFRNLPSHVKATRIPLKQCPGEPICFTSADITLGDGDIVYVEPRRDEYFYTGGLLPGGQYPLPRDEDLDIIEAIALANGSVGGLGGGPSVAVLRAGAGVGNIIPPTRALVLRKLPNGQQLPIRVDLNVAMRDPKERIRIMAGDYVMMYYKPGETASNALLNFFNLNLSANIK